MQTENLLFQPQRRPDTRRLSYLWRRYLRWLETLFKAYFTERFGDIPAMTVSTVCVEQTDISSSSSVRQLWATWTHTAVHKHTHTPTRLNPHALHVNPSTAENSLQKNALFPPVCVFCCCCLFAPVGKKSAGSWEPQTETIKRRTHRNAGGFWALFYGICWQ